MLSVAFLRGINVGGHRVAKEELIDVFQGLGFDRVSTFLASGNVLFDPDPDPDPDGNDDNGGSDETTTADRIAAGLESALGYAVPTTIRTGLELTAIAEYEPFPADIVAERGKPQVMLMFERASEKTMTDVLAMPGSGDLLAFAADARELHWLPTTGILDSDLDLDGITGLVGINTMRTINTIRRIAPKL